MSSPDVCVFATRSAGVIAAAQSLLAAERIEYWVKNELGYKTYATNNAMTGPMEIWVGAADANESRIILKDLTETS